MTTVAPENAFTCDLQLRWSDQDLNGHVNNARVIILAEEARVLAGRGWSDNAPSGTTPRVLKTLTARFDVPVRYERALCAKVWIARIGNTSYTVCHELFQDDELCTYVEAVVVVLDPETDRPAPVGPSLRKGLTKFLAPSRDSRQD